jgi:translation initiation factor 3 subunit F
LQALFSILDHTLRRNADQDRVIGTLLGVRSEDGSEVEIRNAFAVPHTEILNEQVEVEMEYQRNMLALHLKANPREVLVGWYATSSELNQFSALIQNFYGSQGDGTYPHPAVHLTVSAIPGQDVETRAYVSAPVGVTTERIQDSASFIPVPCEIRYGDAEKSGLELIAAAKDREERAVAAITDVESLERALEEVLGLIDRASEYVNSVLDEEKQPSASLGQFLLDALALAPKVEPADIERDLYVCSVALEGSRWLTGYSNNHIQDVLVISYLANTIRTQIELSNRLATAALASGASEGSGAAGGSAPEAGQQRGARDQRTGGRGRNQRETDRVVS